MSKPNISVYAVLGVMVGAGMLAGSAAAQTPKRGGTITLPYEGEPNTFDCHAAGGNNVLAFIGPQYSSLVRYDINAYPKIVGDVAESWTISPDAMTYTFKLRPNVKFHDGSALTATDIKATYDRIINPPTGLVSIRKADFADIAAIEVVDPLTVAFKLSQRNNAMMTMFANELNCIQSARRLADPAYYATNVMGTGPFQFVEYQKGQVWTSKRFDGYFRPGLPYLDGIKYVVMGANAPVTAIAGSQIDGVMRILSPQEIETIKNARGDKVRFYTTVTTTLVPVAINSSRKPFDDVRVRRALNLAIDRRGGIEPLKAISNMATFGALLRPGTEMAYTDAELEKVPGFGKDINAARAESRRLLAEAGQSGMKFKVLTRPVTNPWITLGVFMIDQWRQVGLNAELNAVEAIPYQAGLSSGDYDVAVDFSGPPSDDPTVEFIKMVPGSASNFGRYTDPMLTDLYQRQKAAIDPAERRKLVTSFQDRVMDQAYVAPMFWAGWTAVLGSDIHGWTNTPTYSSAGYDHAETWRD